MSGIPMSPLRQPIVGVDPKVVFSQGRRIQGASGSILDSTDVMLVYVGQRVDHESGPLGRILIGPDDEGVRFEGLEPAAPSYSRHESVADAIVTAFNYAIGHYERYVERMSLSGRTQVA